MKIDIRGRKTRGNLPLIQIKLKNELEGLKVQLAPYVEEESDDDW